MVRILLVGILGAISLTSPAWASCSVYPHSLGANTLAKAQDVMDNFSCAALTSGATLNAASFTGTTVFSNSSGNTLTLDKPNGAAVAFQRSGTLKFLMEDDSVSSSSLGFYSWNGSSWDNLVNFKSNGAVGIGTSVPDEKLSVNGAVRVTSNASNWNTTASGIIDYYSNNMRITAGAPAATNNGITFYTTSGGTNITAMQITAAGNVGVGTTSPSYRLFVNGTAGGTSGFTNTSDGRLKKGVRRITNALSIVSKINGVRFSWRPVNERIIGKDLALPISEPQIGFVAQDLRSVLPEAVIVAQDSAHTMSVAESKIVPLLVEAIKELKVENDRQVKVIDSMQARIGHLEQLAGVRVARLK